VFYLQLSYLCYLCLFGYSGVQHIVTYMSNMADVLWETGADLADALVHPRVLDGSVLLIVLVFCVVFLLSFTSSCVLCT
jgi:hypothetical protein